MKILKFLAPEKFIDRNGLKVKTHQNHKSSSVAFVRKVAILRAACLDMYSTDIVFSFSSREDFSSQIDFQISDL